MSGKRHMKPKRRAAGFSLIEVMVALIVCSVGLLGLAKMTSLSIASEDVAGTRTMAALEASSLAAMMHADRGYWASAAATTSAVVTWNNATSPAAVNISDGNLQQSVNCQTAGPCTPVQMAAYDVTQWGTTLNTLLPGFTATIICTQPVTVGPVTCTININWVERAVGLDTNQANQLLGQQLAAPSYTLNVQP
jgi:type IV pilus assembly protein PilV